MNQISAPRIFISVITISLLSVLPAMSAELDFSLDPSTIRLTGKPGEVQEFTIKATNQGSKPIRVDVELSDMVNDTDVNGELFRVYAPPGTSETSLSKVLAYTESEFLVPQGESHEMNLVLTVPDGIGSFSSVVFFKGVSVIEGEDDADSKLPRSKVMIQPRLGVLVFCDVDGTVNRTGSLESLTFKTPDEEGPFRIDYELKNTGNADILLTGEFFIFDDNNSLIAKDAVNAFRTFPGDKGGASTEWYGYLEAGNYHLVVNMELGPDATEVIVKEFDFTIDDQ